MAGLQVGLSGEYVMTDKLLDNIWLGPILCTILFRFEFTRKSKEAMEMMNETYNLEKEAEKEGEDIEQMIIWKSKNNSFFNLTQPQYLYMQISKMASKIDVSSA